MVQMFCSCYNLKSLNLSSFDTSNVEQMYFMFNRCTNLEYLDISNFKISQGTNTNNIFYNVKSLKYINLYNAQINSKINIINLIKASMTDSAIVYQKDDIIKDKTYIKACCEFNNNILNCYPHNYITMQYNQNISYEYGFQYNENNITRYREGISYIKNEENTIISPSEQLEIKPDSKIEIHLDISIKSLANFFNSDYDDNTKNITSIDFSHFDSSLITNMDSLFSGCSSLQQLVLNNFITKSETLMSNIFPGCNNLKYLNISGFNLSSYDFIKNFSNLEFINIYKTQNYDIDTINNINKDLNIYRIN